MNTNHLKFGLFVTAAISLLTACNTPPVTPTTQTTTTPNATSPVDVTSNLLNQKDKAIESSGRLYLSSLARGQQAFFLEKNKFSSSIDDIGIGIKAEDNNYLLQIIDTQPKSVNMTATAKQDNVKSFAASVFVVGNTGSESTIFILCGTDTPSKTPPTVITAPKSETDKPTCPTGSSPVNN